jgi:hypothetical protein
MAGRTSIFAGFGLAGLSVLFVVAIWRTSAPTPDATPAPQPQVAAPAPPALPPVIVEDARPPSAPRELHVGPRGGCYYVSDSGNKTYVARSECAGISAPAVPEQRLVAPALESSAPTRGSGGGRQLHVGPRGGCYYINGSGNKTYVDRSACY